MSWYNDFPHTRTYDQDVGWLIEEYKKLDKQVADLLACCDTVQDAIAAIQKWIREFDTAYIEEVVRRYLMTAIFVQLSDAGYIIYYIPSSWSQIKFNTTGLDIEVELEPQYGHLVLSY